MGSDWWNTGTQDFGGGADILAQVLALLDERLAGLQGDRTVIREDAGSDAYIREPIPGGITGGRDLGRAEASALDGRARTRGGWGAAADSLGLTGRGRDDGPSPEKAAARAAKRLTRGNRDHSQINVDGGDARSSGRKANANADGGSFTHGNIDAGTNLNVSAKGGTAIAGDGTKKRKRNRGY
ncbi:MAG TPA: hypothetical protein VK689_03160 [Armatimonadota bacterium]|nr:hypothetical protein [Armatimonadota bacterium]